MENITQVMHTLKENQSHPSLLRAKWGDLPLTTCSNNKTMKRQAFIHACPPNSPSIPIRFLTRCLIS